MMGCSFPDGKIVPASKTEECKQNLVEALNAFSTKLGLPIDVSIEDATTIFNSGGISKSYGRDGNRYTVSFALESGDESCKLIFYHRRKKGPGENTSTFGEYGSVTLTSCMCE